ncbi:hypothetical protein WJX74_000112 [Apatococcus lobatus]|uniref:glutaredoxin-dependent peroxiredoxin n=1 Tax=Apatococcus lobatus TaxID=904363 RepID=A0AAW1RCL5_9CHLO
MMESHGDAEEEEQRREDVNQHRGHPEDTSEVRHSEEPKGVEAKADIDTETYQPGVRSHGTDVPAGHFKSDLSATSCSLVLGRRRDLTLRGDIKLSRNNHTATLNQLLKNRIAIVFGVPDMGPVCSEQHVPGYLEKLDEILDCGIDRVYCVPNAPPQDVAMWSQKVGIDDKPKIEAWADDHGSFTRMLGLEASNPTESGSGSHRWAAITQDGILLKMKVEIDPTEVKETSADTMLDCWRYFKELESA